MTATSRRTMAMALAILATGCSNGGTDAVSGADGGLDPREQTTEYKLAVVDGAAVTPDDPAVEDYAVALENLESACRNPREQLGDMAVTAQELLANGGVSEGLLSILRNVSLSIPEEAPETNCEDIFASYVVLRGGEA
jgi:hypothetical protein